jgi:hypothetical protein
MKKIELRKVPCGETFIAFGEEFVVLDHVDGGVLSLRKSIWKKAQFDGNGNSNLAEASIRKVLGDYVDHLKCAGATDDAILPMCVDLKATDGTRMYGYCDCDAGLLTLEQYGKYKDIIPLADDWWWLATPVWTRWLRSPNTRPQHRRRVERLLRWRLQPLVRQPFRRRPPRFDFRLLPLGLLAGRRGRGCT